ncbi:unnamed protein product [Vicia faba]|uniref:Uncharacterized protein n=1 Tax=Vicia faba TaxID=3906 RepID=A0AAV0ZT17_VICFA|nr:unnamed protein product [Vicia faba]
MSFFFFFFLAIPSPPGYTWFPLLFLLRSHLSGLLLSNFIVLFQFRSQTLLTSLVISKLKRNTKHNMSMKMNIEVSLKQERENSNRTFRSRSDGFLITVAERIRIYGLQFDYFWYATTTGGRATRQYDEDGSPLKRNVAML